MRESPVPDNYLIFAAGESDQTAGVLDEVRHGRFSYFVFKGLEGEADANQDGKISAGELHAYVKESVGRFSAGAQTPTMLGDAGRWVVRELKLLILIPLYALMLFIASAVTVNAITFEVSAVDMGICPPALARAEFEKDKLFSLLEGQEGHLGTEIRDIVLAQLTDQICPLLGL